MRERAGRLAAVPEPHSNLRTTVAGGRAPEADSGGAEAPERCAGLSAALPFKLQPDIPPRPRGGGDQLAGKRSANLIGTARIPLTFAVFFLVFGSAFGGGFTFRRSVTVS